MGGRRWGGAGGGLVKGEGGIRGKMGLEFVGVVKCINSKPIYLRNLTVIYVMCVEETVKILCLFIKSHELTRTEVYIWQLHLKDLR